MNFDLQSVTACVRNLAAKMLPGWLVTCELAQSVEANSGALAMVFSTPERQLAHVVVAPHPPGEDIGESVAHEMTHAAISPLTALIEWSPAAVMLEEQIVERLSKIIAGASAGMTRAISRALSSPRTPSATIKKRISALASRRIKGKYKMADGARLAELAMKAGEMGAREDVPEDVRALLAEFVAELAGGSGPASEPPMMDKDPKDGPPEPGAPPMREDQMPPAMRSVMRNMRKAEASTLKETIRLRLHTARTVDGILLNHATEMKLAEAKTLEQFDREFGLVTSGAEKGKARSGSGVVPGDTTGANGAPSIESLVQAGHSREMATQIVTAFGVGADHGKAALETANKYRKAAPHG